MTNSVDWAVKPILKQPKSFRKLSKLLTTDKTSSIFELLLFTDLD